MPNELVPPHSLEAEQALLGALFLDVDLIGPCRRIIRHERFFYKDAHRHIWLAMLKLYDAGVRSIDWITVKQVLEKSDTLDAAGGEAYLEEITVITPVADGAEQYAHIVREKAKLRGIATIAARIHSDAYNAATEPDRALNSAVAELANLDALTSPIGNDNGDVGKRAIEWFRSLADPNSSEVLFCGHPVIDQGAMGFNLGGLSQLIGPSGSGKTFFAHQLMIRMKQVHGTRCGMVQGEMKDYRLVVRQAAGHVGMKANLRIADARRNGQEPSLSDEREALAAERRIEAMIPFMYDVVCPESMDLDVIEAHIRELAGRGCKFILVDYLQRISMGKKDGVGELKGIVDKLKALSVSLDIHVCCLSQIIVSTARDKERTNWDLGKWDSYGGANAVNDFDLIATVFRPCLADDRRAKGLIGFLGEKAAKGVVVVKISKARFGESELHAFWLNKNSTIGLTVEPASDSVEQSLLIAAGLGTVKEHDEQAADETQAPANSF